MERLKIDDMEEAVRWFIIAGITALGNHAVEKVMDNAPAAGVLDIQFIVNGVELPVEKIIKRILEQDEERIREESCDIIHERFSDLEDLLEDLRLQVTQKIEVDSPDFIKGYKIGGGT